MTNDTKVLVGVALVLWWLSRKTSTGVTSVNMTSGGTELMQSCTDPYGNVYQSPVSSGPCGSILQSPVQATGPIPMPPEAGAINYGYPVTTAYGLD